MFFNIYIKKILSKIFFYRLNNLFFAYIKRKNILLLKNCIE